MGEDGGKKKGKFAAWIIIGMTMFATQFGAGNLIFPPFLGRDTGTAWPVGFFAFAIMDVILSGIGILAVSINRQGDVNGILGKIGKTPATIMLTLIILCIGPGLAIPRTAATSYEMGIHKMFPGLPLWAFGLVFFAVVIVCVMKPSRVVDIVGRFLTPILLAFMLFMIVMGIVNPLGEPVKIEGIVPFKDGIINGYQTMDGLGCVLAALIGITAMASYGYTTKREQLQVFTGAMPVAQGLLLIVYGGLAVLGASVSGNPDFAGLEQAPLLVKITDTLLGSIGVYVLALIVLLACLTTAIGLVMVAGNHFEELTHGKVGYKTVILIVVVVSYLLSNFGLAKIISIAVPILSTLYPPMIVLVIMAYFDRIIKRDHIAAVAAYVAFAYALCETLHSLGLPLGFVTMLPFAEMGLGWILPAVLGGIVGAFIPGKRWDADDVK